MSTVRRLEFYGEEAEVICRALDEYERKIKNLEQQLAAKDEDLKGYILCDAEPVAWMFADDEELGYFAFNRKAPTKEQIEYLAKYNRPAWEPLYKARKP